MAPSLSFSRVGLALALAAVLAAPAPAKRILRGRGKVIRASRIRAPRKSSSREQKLPLAPTKKFQQPWETRTEPRPLRRSPQTKGFNPFREQHDREWPTFYGDPRQRIWNGRPGFGAGISQYDQPGVRPEQGRPVTEDLLGEGGLRGHIRDAIRKGRAERYQRKLEGVRLMEQYRAEKALLGLCPVDACEKPRFILEGKSFSPEGYCREHAEHFYGKRVGWAMEGVEERREERERKRLRFVSKWHSGARFGHRPHPLDMGPTGDANAARQAIGQAPFPEEGPRPGDLGPVGTLPMMADPRDPAGYPYNTIDADADLFERSHGEQRSWVQVSQQAP